MTPAPKRFDVVTFGETMIRLSPPGAARIETADSLDLAVGGSESNTAVALAHLGRSVAWWSKLPDNPLGLRIAEDIRRWGVDTSLVRWTESGRAGLYFIEFGSPPRAHQVYYDRADSTASALTPDEIDWPHLDSARHLHISGITPALSSSCEATCLRAVREARERGLTVSLDVNYRRKLWSHESARSTLSALFPFTDRLICPNRDAACVFGLKGTPTEIARSFQESYGLKRVVITAGLEGAIALSGDQQYSVEAVPSVAVDRVGSGDAFTAGVIDGYLDGDMERGLRFGVAMAALKCTIPGDQLVATRAEIESAAAGVSAGIQR